MISLRLTQFVAIAAATLLSACGAGAQPPAASLSPGSSLARERFDHRGSWMLPDAGKQWLLYVSDEFDGIVDVYNWHSKKGKLYGQLTGLSEPAGECSDTAGNVYVTDYGSGTIYEYPHGATTWSVRASDYYGRPYGCGVDTKSGDIAVSNQTNLSGYAGNVVVYSGGGLIGYQHTYSSPSLRRYFPGGYDRKGNLFLEATNATTQVELAELPKGSNDFVILSGLSISEAANVQWDGKHITVTDNNYQNGGHAALSRISVMGSSVTVLGTTVLTDTCSTSGDYTNVYFPIITGTRRLNTVVGGNWGCNNRFDFWNYPQGGNPVKVLPPDIAPTYPAGAALSPPNGAR